MGISRKTFWNDLQKARHKVVYALVNGKGITISEGEHINTGECEAEFHCKGCEHSWELQDKEGRPKRCPICSTEIISGTGGEGRDKGLIGNDYCCPKNRKKAEQAKSGSVENDENCYTINE